MPKGITVVALVVAASAGTAQASFIESWNYSISNQIIAWEPDTSKDGAVESSLNYRKLSWGYGDNKSSVEVRNASGTVKTNGFGANGPELIYTNNRNEDPENVSLTEFFMSGWITVSPSGRPDERIGLGRIEQRGLVYDAPSGQNEGNDIVSVTFGAYYATGSEYIYWPPGGGEPEFFHIDGVSYRFSLDTIGSDRLTEDQCESLGNPYYCSYGLVTPEGYTNNLVSHFRMTADEPISVPEPYSLALFGFGLVGIGFVCNRRKQYAN